MTNALMDGLDVLPFGWHLLHRVGVDQQVIVGPGGVFLLEGRVGDHVDSERLSVLLSLTCGFEVECEPVALVGGAVDPTADVDHVDDVHVLPADVLDRWLQHMPRRLSDETVTDIIGRSQIHAGWRP